METTPRIRIFLFYITLAVFLASLPIDRRTAHASGTAPTPGPDLTLRFEDRADTNDVAEHVSPVTLSLLIEGETVRIPYYANRTLGTTYPEVTRAVLVLHGTLRNADEYQASIELAAQMVGGAGDTTFVITPQFLTEPDIDRFHLPDTYAYWAYMGWRKGDLSVNTTQNPRPVVLSSFTVADSILARLAGTCPNLSQVVLAGHSAGGQFSNLYTAGTTIHEHLASIHGVAVRSIVSNPSSYLYFSPERWVDGTAYAFDVPTAQQLEECPEFDDYKYGLQSLNPYMATGSDSLQARYPRREVIYLLGGADTNPYDYYLDRDCPAMLQGDHRLERGTVYGAFLEHHFGPSIWTRQARAVVPGVGHDHEGMFTSACGLYFIFDFGTCDPDPPGTAWVDVTTSLLATPTCHGSAWGDFDEDDDPDLFLPATDHQDRLARNDGGSFSDATAPPLNNANRGMSAQWGDYDNDGRLDLFVVHWQDPNTLYHNEGDGEFTEATPPALMVEGDCVDAAWADYDGDGDLDLYILRVNNQSCHLARNDGGGVFTDVTASPLNLTGNNRGVAWGDYDDDGDLDLFVARDQSDRLFRNDGGGQFTNVTSGPLNDNAAGSSAAWGDYDNDGDLDLYVVNRMSANRLLRNDGGGDFTSITQSPVNDSGNGHSASWADYDNDGWLDLYLCNDGQPNRLFRNRGDGSFEDVSVSPVDHQAQSYSGAWGDIEGDGDLDLYLAVNNGPNRLFRNQSSLGRHWMRIDLVGTVSNVSAVGARVSLLAGGMWQIRQVGGDSGYMAQNERTVAFGLGGAALIDSIVVRWPSGIVQRMGGGLYPDWRMTLIESSVPMEEEITGLPAGSALRVTPNPLRERTEISFELSRPAWARLELFDVGGRRVRELADGPCAAGTHRVTLARSGLSRGCYFVRLDVDGRATGRRSIVID